MGKSIKCRYRSYRYAELNDKCLNCLDFSLCESHSKSIFIIDDDIDQLNELEEFFILSGYDCRKFTSVKSALEDLRLFLCDIILTDHNLEDLDGLFFARYAKDNGLANLVILNSAADVGEVALANGVYFFPKPLDIRSLNKFLIKKLFELDSYL